MTTDSIDRNALWRLRRGEPRVALRVQIKLDGTDKMGRHFVEETTTVNVSREGACVETCNALEVGALMTVTAFDDKFTAKARVAIVWSRKSPSNKFRVGLRFVEPSENWIVQ